MKHTVRQLHPSQPLTGWMLRTGNLYAGHSALDIRNKAPMLAVSSNGVTTYLGVVEGEYSVQGMLVAEGKVGRWLKIEYTHSLLEVLQVDFSH